MVKLEFHSVKVLLLFSIMVCKRYFLERNTNNQTSEKGNKGCGQPTFALYKGRGYILFKFATIENCKRYS